MEKKKTTQKSVEYHSDDAHQKLKKRIAPPYYDMYHHKSKNGVKQRFI